MFDTSQNRARKICPNLNLEETQFPSGILHNFFSFDLRFPFWKKSGRQSLG